MKDEKKKGADKPKQVEVEVVKEEITTSEKTMEVATMQEMPAKMVANSIDMAVSLEQKQMFAEQMIRSGLLPATLASPDMLDDEEYRDKAIGAVIAVVEYGRELNVSPWVALHGMHVVQGRVVMGIHVYMGMALKNNILVDVVQDYAAVRNKEGKLTDYITTVEITRKHAHFNNLVKVYTYSKRWGEIKKLGFDTKENYVKMPGLMMRTRCITEALKLYAADIFIGAQEVTDMMDHSSITYEVDDEGGLKQ